MSGLMRKCPMWFENDSAWFKNGVLDVTAICRFAEMLLGYVEKTNDYCNFEPCRCLLGVTFIRYDNILSDRELMLIRALTGDLPTKNSYNGVLLRHDARPISEQSQVAGSYSAHCWSCACSGPVFASSGLRLFALAKYLYSV